MVPKKIVLALKNRCNSYVFFLSRLTSLISSLISSRVISGNSPLSAIALISANAAFALAVTSSSSSWAFCWLSFRMVSDVCAISLSYKVILSECKYTAL